MPLPYGDISAVTVAEIVPNIVDNYYKVSPTFALIFKGDTVRPFPGGTQIQQPIQYAPLKAGPFAAGSTFDISYVNTDTAMTFLVKFYYANVTIQGTQIPINRGDNAVMSFVEEKMVNGSQALAAALAGDLYGDGQGTVTSQIALDGLLAAYDDGTNYPSYGGLSRAAIGSGANNGINGYYLNVAGPISIPTLQKAYGQATFGNRQPNLIATTQVVYNSLYNKMVPAQRVMDTTSDLFSIGFQALRFNNQRLVVDLYCPAGYIFGMNTDFLNAHISEQELFGFGFTGFKELPNSVDAAGQLCFGGNIVTSAPRLGFICAGVTA
jgi:hypothetical protein